MCVCATRYHGPRQSLCSGAAAIGEGGKHKLDAASDRLRLTNSNSARRPALLLEATVPSYANRTAVHVSYVARSYPYTRVHTRMSQSWFKDLLGVPNQLHDNALQRYNGDSDTAKLYTAIEHNSLYTIHYSM